MPIAVQTCGAAGVRPKAQGKRPSRPSGAASPGMRPVTRFPFGQLTALWRGAWSSGPEPPDEVVFGVVALGFGGRTPSASAMAVGLGLTSLEGWSPFLDETGMC